jgi:hypothetical protein
VELIVQPDACRVAAVSAVARIIAGRAQPPKFTGQLAGKKRRLCSGGLRISARFLRAGEDSHEPLGLCHSLRVSGGIMKPLHSTHSEQPAESEGLRMARYINVGVWFWLLASDRVKPGCYQRQLLGRETEPSVQHKFEHLQRAHHGRTCCCRPRSLVRR